jgi:two-component system, NtrC family, response regulator AtoC
VLRALVVDDESNSRCALARLVAEQGFAARTAGSVREARDRLLAEPSDVVLLDMTLPDGTAFDLIQDLQEQADRAQIVVITGNTSLNTAIEALRHGACDYLTKPVDTARLQAILANLARSRDPRPRINEMCGQVSQLGGFGPLVGSSPAMRQVYDLLGRVAPSSASVLITGESGTGKELAAQTIQQLSRRQNKPFLVVNCASVSASLIDSDLFGHERGSFTGAERAHQGYFERADGGTLFLDEVSEMPAELQAKLLRVLEAGTLTRVGGEKTVKVDVRILAATNRDLDAEVASGRFRRDLLYRLNVFPIHMPPLCERSEDIEALAENFLDALNQQEGTCKTLARAAVDILRRCAWPGNVRELKNVIHRAFILADPADGEIGPACLAPGLSSRSPGSAIPAAEAPLPPASLGTVAEAERRLIFATLDHFGGNRRKASKALGVSLRTLYNRLKGYGAA